MLGHETVGRSTKEYKIKQQTRSRNHTNREIERERERENQRKKRDEDSHVVGDAGVYLSGIYSNVDLLEVFGCVVSDFSKMKKRSSCIKSKSAKPKGYSIKIEQELESYFLFFK